MATVDATTDVRPQTRRRWVVTAVLLIEVTYVSQVILAQLGLELPLVRPLLGLLLVAFVPGVLLVDLFDLETDSLLDRVLYAVGLSLTVTMALALVMDATYPLAGIEQPYALLPLLVTLLVGINALLYVYAMQVTPSTWVPTDVSASEARWALGFLVLPVYAGLAAHVVNMYDENALVIVVLAVAVSIPLLVSFELVPARVVPVAIWSTGFTLLVRLTVVTSHLWGWDIHFEYYATRIVAENLRWQLPIQAPTDVLLSMTVLPVVFGVVMDVDVVWIFKLAYPFLFSLVPLVVYSFTRHVFDRRIAALAPFVFLTYYGFFKDMPDKQHIAELFLGLLVLTVVHRQLDVRHKKGLVVVFAAGVVASHYGTSFLLVGLLAATILGLALFINGREPVLTWTFWGVFVVVTVAWYMYAFGGHKFETVVISAVQIVGGLLEQLQSPASRSGIGYATRSLPGPLWRVYRMTNYVLMGLLGLGVLRAGLEVLRSAERRRLRYHFLAFPFFALVGAAVVAPIGFGIDRILQLGLLVLAPYVVIGARTGLEIVGRVAARVSREFDGDVSTTAARLLGVFLVVYASFSTGVAFELAGTETPTYAIDLDRGNWNEWNAYHAGEVAGVRWTKARAPTARIASLPGRTWYSKDYPLVLEYYHYSREVVTFTRETTELPDGTCIYLGRDTAVRGELPYIEDNRRKFVDLRETAFYREVLRDRNKIYDSGTSEVYGC